MQSLPSGPSLSVRRAMVRRDAVLYYLSGSLWAVPALAVVAALVIGGVLARIDVGVESWLAFQGTADDARNLLVDIASTMVTVIALVLGLAVVALQMSSSQYSPRLLRNVLRDRANQVVLGVLVGTFVYSAAGLFTVGDIAGGGRTEIYPRFAITVAIVLLFLSLASLVFFADHLAHSIQVDRIMHVVERRSLAVVRTTTGRPTAGDAVVPDWAATVTELALGLRAGGRRRAAGRLGGRTRPGRSPPRPRVGDHVVAGMPLAVVWAAAAGRSRRRVDGVGPALAATVRMGFERTQEHDIALGLRQLVDVACKALSPAVNDPYTAVQAVEHLSVILGELAGVRTDDLAIRDSTGHAVVVVPQHTFADHLTLCCGMVRRYGAAEPTVVHAVLRLLTTCAVLAREDPAYRDAVEQQAELLLSAAHQSGVDPADLDAVLEQDRSLRHELERRRSSRSVE